MHPLIYPVTRCGRDPDACNDHPIFVRILLEGLLLLLLLALLALQGSRQSKLSGGGWSAGHLAVMKPTLLPLSTENFVCPGLVCFMVYRPPRSAPSFSYLSCPFCSSWLSSPSSCLAPTSEALGFVRIRGAGGLALWAWGQGSRHELGIPKVAAELGHFKQHCRPWMNFQGCQ